MFALADCNNFYVSCERVFQPKLQDQPVVVLSNNDGCVISRSNQAKALGIAMGVPFFKIKTLCRQHGIKIFSSNYPLYGDMSQRVMTVLELFSAMIEYYSIDEAFLRFEQLGHEALLTIAQQMRASVLQWTGIPISIGLGQTKTLAKLASYIAKKHLKQNIFYLSSGNYHDDLLARIPVGELWGVGRRWAKQLTQQGIRTVLQFKQMDLAQLRKNFGIVLERTCRELQGMTCLDLVDISPKKQHIVCSRAFGQKQTAYQPIAQALAQYVASACAKLRAQDSMAQGFSIFLMTNLHSSQHKSYYNRATYYLAQPSNDTRVITYYAQACLKKIYQTGFNYHKTGIMLFDLTNTKTKQFDLLQDTEQQQKQVSKNEQVMRVLDQINQRMGRHTLVTAAQGFKLATAMRSDYRSPRYTSCWQELLRVV